MATKTITLTGKVKFCQPFKVSQWGKYETLFYPDQKSYEIFLGLLKQNGNTEGLKNILKQDEDGYYTRIACQSEKEIKGKHVTFPPPTVLDGNRKDEDGNYFPFPRDTWIGNGSDCTIGVDYYRFKKPFGDGFGTAIRWKTLIVNNLVPYVSNRDISNDDQKKLVEEASQQPANFWE